MDHNPYAVGQEINPSTTGLPGAKFEASVRTMQIIAAALMMGVLMFLGVVLVVTQGNIGGMKNAAILTMVGAGFGFVMIVTHFTIPGVITRAQLRTAAAAGLLDSWVQEKLRELQLM
ncbi:MAG: hypothetical protein WKF77_05845 [Planctomycetaceae bacterium]